MKINTKLLINITLPIAASLIIVLIMAVSVQKRNEAERKNVVAMSLLSEMNDLNQRTYYYLLYKEERAKREWFLIYDSLSGLASGTNFNNIEQDAILGSIRKNLGEFRNIFARRIREEAPSGTDGTLIRERQDRLSGQLLVRARFISLDAYRLYQLTNSERRLYRKRANTLILLVLSGWLLITLGTLLPINRTISRSLSRLTEGAGIIGSGNLEHKIDLRTKDELGQLSKAFDKMTESLKALTVSRDELAREMAERRKAENALRRSEAILKQAGEIAHLGAWEIEFSDDGPADESPLRWSDEVYRIFGYKPGSVPVSNDLFFERVHPDDRGRIREAVSNAIAQRAPYSIEHRVVRPDGSERTVYEHAEVIFENGGAPVRMIGAVQDITERKRIEEALKQNERFLQTIIETAPACVKLVAADGTLLMMNRGGLAIIGAVSFEQVQGKSIFPLVAASYRPAFIELTRKVFQGGTGKLEFEAVGLKGRRIWLDTHAVPLYDNARRVTALLGITVDITDRKNAELALEQSKRELERSVAQLETIFNNLTDGLVVADLNADLFHWNPAAIAMHGFGSLEECQRRLPEFSDIFELSTEEEGVLPLERWPLTRILRGETLLAWEVRIRRRGADWSRVFSYGGTLARDRNGKPLLAVVVVSDITERKLRDEEFKKVSRLNELMLEYAGEGIFGLDLDGNVTFVNAVAAHMLGYHRKELLGSHSHRTWHYKKTDSSRYPPEECPIYAAYNQGSIHSGEETFWRKDGTGFPIDFTSRPLYEAGKISGAVVMFRDITGRKQAEENLQKLLADLDRSNKELEQFAYVASHDLQEPLRMVASYVQLLEKKYTRRLDEKAQKYINFAVDGVKRMQRLIDGLLAYSRVARGREFTTVETAHALTQAALNLSAAIRESGAAITTDALPAVAGDEIQLTQLFQNLVANAVKFRKPDAAPEVRVSAVRGQNEWIFSVRDNGIGLDPQYASRIFLIFQRLHGRDEYPGTGIGLALCKRIVERHRGRIWVESEPGQGSTFFFTIPAG